MLAQDPVDDLVEPVDPGVERPGGRARQREHPAVVVVADAEDQGPGGGEARDDRVEVVAEGQRVEVGVQRVVDADQEHGQVRPRGDRARELHAAHAGHPRAAAPGVHQPDPVGRAEGRGEQGAEPPEQAGPDRVAELGSRGVPEHGERQGVVTAGRRHGASVVGVPARRPRTG